MLRIITISRTWLFGLGLTLAACGGGEETFTVTTEENPETGQIDVTIDPANPEATPISVVVNPSPTDSSEPTPAPNMVQAFRFKSFYDIDASDNRYLHGTANADGADVASLELVESWHSQQWVLEQYEGDAVRIRNRWTGYYLTAVDDWAWSRPKLKLYVNNDSQLWEKQEKRSGTIAFQNLATKLYLNVESGDSNFEPTLVSFNEAWDGLLWLQEFVDDIDPYSIPVPTPAPQEPTTEPSVPPTAGPTPAPTMIPTAGPSERPTPEPTQLPTAEPTTAPTALPTPSVTPEPTAQPTTEPTAQPTPVVGAGEVEVLHLENAWTSLYLAVPNDQEYSNANSMALEETWEQMQWVFEPIEGSDAVYLRNRWTGYVLTDSTGRQNGLVASRYPEQNNGSQQWLIEDGDLEGTIQLRNVSSGRYLHPASELAGDDMKVINYAQGLEGILWHVSQADVIDRDELTEAPEPAPGPEGAKPQTSTHNYGHALQLTPLYFAANQLGTLSDRRLSWRRDSQTDGQYSGGYVDAGDNILFGKAQFAAISSMCITLTFFEDELKEIGQYDEILRQAKHGTDFILKGHAMDGSGNTQSLVVQLGSSPVDHPKWISIEESTHWRPAYKIDRNKRGSDYAGLAAAATGICSGVMQGSYADQLRSASDALFRFAKNYRGLGHENGDIVTVYKNANRDEDELAYGAIGRYVATGNTAFLDEADRIMDDDYLSMWQTDYEHSEQIVSTLLAVWGNKANRQRRVLEYFNSWKYVSNGELKQTEGGYIVHDSNNWGSSGGVLPTLTNMAIYSKAKNTTEWDAHIKSQIDYLLGSNPPGNSYICGYGTDQNCSKIHHRGASGVSGYGGDYKNKYMLWGAVLGGVTENDWDFVNSHDNWKGNEPTVAYNSKVQSPLLYLYSKYGGAPMSDEALQSKLDNWGGYQ